MKYASILSDLTNEISQFLVRKRDIITLGMMYDVILKNPKENDFWGRDDNVLTKLETYNEDLGKLFVENAVHIISKINNVIL